MKCMDPYLHFQRDRRIQRYQFSIARSMVFLRGVKPLMVTDCWKCLHCKKKRARNLATRCVLHASCFKQNMFLTLTYDEKLIGYHNTLVYKHVQDFTRALRRYVDYHFKQRIDVFNVHEYGKNGKKHWHLIVFGFDFPDKKFFTTSNGLPLYTSEKLSDLWSRGHCTIGDVSEASAMYQAQYMEKDVKNGSVGLKKAKSKHQGLGRPFFMQHYKQILSLGYIPFSGQKVPVFRYFQRLAHRHYCHFYEPLAFFDTKERKAIHRPFKKEEPSREIADLFVNFKLMKNDYVSEMEVQFEEVVAKFLSDKDDPDFVKSGSNSVYDFNKRITSERF